MSSVISNLISLALEEASKERGNVAPNPAVGAVVYLGTEIISVGYHRGPGSAHAEVDALTKAGGRARGASMLVTLEPCCHWGRTPPCTEAIIEAGLKEVFYCYQDPNPVVSGNAEKFLTERGIACGRLKSTEVDRFYEGYSFWWKTKRPFVTAKLALSLDGKIANADGSPIKLSGPEADRFTHEQRRQSDAILTTAKTVLADNPKLNARVGDEIFPKKLFVLDNHLEIDNSFQIHQTASSVTILSGLSLLEALYKIGETGCQSLWVEAGGNLFSTLVREKLVNRALLYVCPVVLGGAGKSAFESLPFPSPLKSQWSSLGPDGLCTIEW